MPDGLDARIGFIGTGVMGLPMARHLADAGANVTVFTRTLSRAEPLRAHGVRICQSVAEAIAGVSAVITMLPDTSDVVEVMTGAGGVIASATPGTLVIDMSSISPSATRQLADKAALRGLDYVDAPVSGGQKGAEDATLSIMVGGTDAAVERAMPALSILGRTVRHIGPVGSGQVAKACNQMVVGITIQGLAEALALGARAGLRREDLVAILAGGLARCGVLETRGPRIIAGDFDPGFRVRLHHKDLTIALEAAAEAGLPVDVTERVRDRMANLIEAGGGDLDHTGLIAQMDGMHRPGAWTRPRLRHRGKDRHG